MTSLKQNHYQPYTVYHNKDIFATTSELVRMDQMGSSIVVPHVCNNIDLFGAGFAEAVANRYPEVKANYHLLGQSFLRNNLGHVQFIEVMHNKKYGHKLVFANMIAQNGVRNKSNFRPLNYIALAKSMHSVAIYIKGMAASNKDYASKWTIHCPKFGSGLAGGNWNFISDMIADAWRDTPVYVYQHQNK
jgi:hypothetical protein